MTSLENKIFEALSTNETEGLDTLAISKIVIGVDGTQKMVNPALYKLLKDGKIEKITIENNARPRWKIQS